MSLPLISIIIPTFNRGHLIGETLDSILAQTYQNWECIVVDDGSTDNTDDVMAAYLNKDVRFKYYHRPKDRLPGGNAARNYGFEVSKGEYVQWFDSDDIMHPEMLLKQVGSLNNSTFVFSVCQSLVFENTLNNIRGLRCSNLLSNNPLKDYIEQKTVWLTSAVLWKISFLVKYNLSFDETLKAAQEWEFHIRCLAKNENYGIVNDPLLYLRQHDNSISYSKTNTRIFYYYQARLKVYKNRKLNLEASSEKYLRVYLFNGFKKFIKTRNYNTAFFAYRNFVLMEKHISLSTKVYLLGCLLASKYFNRGNTFMKKFQLNE